MKVTTSCLLYRGQFKNLRSCQGVHLLLVRNQHFFSKLKEKRRDAETSSTGFCQNLWKASDMFLFFGCTFPFSGGIQIFEEQVLSLQDSLTTGSLITTVSRGKPCWLARYKRKG